MESNRESERQEEGTCGGLNLWGHDGDWSAEPTDLAAGDDEEETGRFALGRAQTLPGAELDPLHARPGGKRDAPRAAPGRPVLRHSQRHPVDGASWFRRDPILGTCQDDCNNLLNVA